MISVIIPTLNEAGRLIPVIDALTNEPTPHEVIVVDGGSTDGTLDIIARRDVCFVRSAPGRGQQLFAGAERAKGDVLLFLHADSRFPTGGLAAIAQALRDPAVLGGNFRLLFDGESRFSAWLNGFYAWIRSHGFYYGDSGIFVRQDAYKALGGIRPIALMEDYDFVRRMERAGQTVSIDDPPLITSSRKFEGRAAVAIVWGWLKLHALYHLGVSPARLARMYYGNGAVPNPTRANEWRERNA